MERCCFDILKDIRHFGVERQSFSPPSEVNDISVRL
jgi:hypothetical protein